MSVRGVEVSKYEIEPLADTLQRCGSSLEQPGFDQNRMRDLFFKISMNSWAEWY